MVAYLEGVIIPYVGQVRETLYVGGDQAALVIFDNFKGQLTLRITDTRREQCSICAGASRLDRLVAAIGCFREQICEVFLRVRISKLISQ